MEEIVEASVGVFLWVRLVVQSLLEGLMNRYHVTDLQLRLRNLPTDLDELYQVMLKRFPDTYSAPNLEIVGACLSWNSR